LRRKPIAWRNWGFINSNAGSKFTNAERAQAKKISPKDAKYVPHAQIEVFWKKCWEYSC